MAEIVLDHVNKSYPDGHTAVRDLNLTIADGGISDPGRAFRLWQDHDAEYDCWA